MSVRRPPALSLSLAGGLAGSLLGCALLAIAGHPASAELFEIHPGMEGNAVKFESRAPLETFEGKTDQVHGLLQIDPAHLADSIGVQVEVDLASLDTGIDLRNRHMRENHLETDKFPQAVFHGANLEGPLPPALAPGETVKLLALGRFDLHGVSRRIQILTELTYLETEAGPRLHIQGRFQVNLDDYKIHRPTFLVMKLDKTQRIFFDVVAVPKEEGEQP